MNMKMSQVNMVVSNLPKGLLFFVANNLFLFIKIEYQQLLGDIGGDSFYIR